VPPGSAFDVILSVVAEMLIELRGLKAVRHENDLLAATPYSLSFGSLDKSSSKALPSVPLVNPEVGDFAAASPCVTIDARNDFTVVVLNRASDEPPVGVTRCVDIELVNSVGQEHRNLLASGLVVEFNGSEFHGV